MTRTNEQNRCRRRRDRRDDPCASMSCSRMRTSAAVPPGARLSRRKSSSRRGSLARCSSAAVSADGDCRQAAIAASMRARIVTEGFRQRLEKGDARPGGQRRIVRRESRWPAPRRRPRRGPKAAPRKARPDRRSARAPPGSRRIKARLRSAMLCSMSLKNEVFTATIDRSPHPPGKKQLMIAGGDDKPDQACRHALGRAW